MITVRRADQSDSRSLISLAREWATESGSWVVRHDEHGDIDPDGTIQRLDDPTFCIVVAVDDRRVVGYAVRYDTDRLSGDARPAPSGGHAILDEVMVQQDYSKQGLGTRLVRTFEWWALAQDSQRAR
jgi:GNAT superfamily N-acetyltransferase